MQRRPDLAGVCFTSLWSFCLALSAVVSTGCEVYKRDLLEQTQTPDAALMSTPDAAADGGNVDAAIGAIDAAIKPSNFDPDTCLWGECWWSSGGVDTCRSAGLPKPSDRPAGGDDTARISDIFLGFTELRLGSTNNDGEKSDDAWMEFGFELVDLRWRRSAGLQGWGQRDPVRWAALSRQYVREASAGHRGRAGARLAVRPE
jgi:hypothetical protein